MHITILHYIVHFKRVVDLAIAPCSANDSELDLVGADELDEVEESEPVTKIVAQYKKA